MAGHFAPKWVVTFPRNDWTLWPDVHNVAERQAFAEPLQHGKQHDRVADDRRVIDVRDQGADDDPGGARREACQGIWGGRIGTTVSI